jgi:hypothetical protein
LVQTYMVGSSLWDVARSMEAGAGRIENPRRTLSIASEQARKEHVMQRTNYVAVAAVLAVAAFLAMPLFMDGIGTMGLTGMYPGMMSGYSMPGWSMAVGGVLMLIPWALLFAVSVSLGVMVWLASPPVPSRRGVAAKAKPCALARQTGHGRASSVEHLFCRAYRPGQALPRA